MHPLTFGTETLIFCAVLGTWVAPILAISVLGPDHLRTTQVSLQTQLDPNSQESAL